MDTPCQRERATVFIDGSNWYHAMQKIGVDMSDIDYFGFARKLCRGERDIHEVRYYVGKISGDLTRTRKQTNFLNKLRKQGVTIKLGRVEKRQLGPKQNKIQKKLKKLLSRLVTEGHLIKDSIAMNELQALAAKETFVYVEKRVDVNIAVDMVSQAMKNQFDVAYLVSADGDFIPAVEEVREMGKKVFAATPGRGHELRKAVNIFLILRAEWFSSEVFLNKTQPQPLKPIPR